MKPRVALHGNKLFLRQVICSFLGFIDNFKTLFYKKLATRVLHTSLVQLYLDT